jgi:hypothetical protein
MYYVLYSTYFNHYLCYANNQSSNKQTIKTKYMLHTTNTIRTIRQTIINGSKKLTFMIAMLLTVGISSSFATPTDDINSQVKASFLKDFQKAELMGSEVGKQFTKLTFKMNDMVMFAFYSDNGELLAVTRNIKTSQLPIQLLLQLKKDYNDYWTSDLFELNGEDLNNYYITVENADKKITLRSTNNSTWELYEKTTKK